jgi:hypothetical protein
MSTITRLTIPDRTLRSRYVGQNPLVALANCALIAWPHLAGDGPRPVRAGSGLALGFWPEGVQRLRRSRVGPEDAFRGAV